MSSNTGFSQGITVKWNWGSGTGEGVIKEVFTSDVTRTLKGSEIKRKASGQDPAYLIEQSDGDQVLKSHSEIERC